MGRRALPQWHVYCWDGTDFELVYFDLVLKEANDIIRYNNERHERTKSGKVYVKAKDGEAPVLETP